MFNTRSKNKNKKYRYVEPISFKGSETQNEIIFCLFESKSFGVQFDLLQSYARLFESKHNWISFWIGILGLCYQIF